MPDLFKPSCPPGCTGWCQCPEVTAIDDYETHKLCEMKARFHEPEALLTPKPMIGDLAKSIATDDGWRPTPYTPPPEPPNDKPMRLARALTLFAATLFIVCWFEQAWYLATVAVAIGCPSIVWWAHAYGRLVAAEDRATSWHHGGPVGRPAGRGREFNPPPPVPLPPPRPRPEVITPQRRRRGFKVSLTFEYKRHRD
jgi:hypothetical protein